MKIESQRYLVLFETSCEKIEKRIYVLSIENLEG